MKTVALVLALSCLLGSAAFCGETDEADAFVRDGQYDKALTIYRSAAASGNTKAQFNLGVLSENGNGVDKSPEDAAKWYGKAAAGGLPVAQYAYGAALWFGNGVEKNQEEAVTWYRRAAEQGLPMAQYNLAFAYALGEGTKLDMVQAHVWFVLAARKGIKPAEVNVKRLENRMAPEQVEEARDLAAKWQPKLEQPEQK